MPDGVTSPRQPVRVFAYPQVIYHAADGHILGGGTGDRMEVTDAGMLSGTTVRNDEVTFAGIDPRKTEVYFTDFEVA
jgi:hypothetical protein